MRVLFEQGNFRVVEIADECFSLSDLKGDCYEPRYNPSIDAEELRTQELEFEARVHEEGVYGYVLEAWNSEVGNGWQYVDSCFGFVGQHSIDNEHYIVEELSKQAVRLSEEVK